MICNRHRTISILLSYDPDLLDFLFRPSRLSLQQASRALIRDSAFIGAQEHLLTKIALDLWDSRKRTRLIDAITGLDSHRHDCFMSALEYYKASAASHCQCCRCHNQPTDQEVNYGQ